MLANYVGTAKEISDIAKAKGFNFRRKTISEWARRKKIEPVATKEVNGRPAPMFRFQDVRAAFKNELDSVRM